MKDTLPSVPDLDVYVDGFELSDHPARIRFLVRAGKLRFFSEISYHSIPSWKSLWASCAHSKERLLGALAAWDCMRFLALGGERLILCPGLECDTEVKRLWSECFRKQFGEWRYRNRLVYPEARLPALVTAASPPGAMSACIAPSEPRWLLTNGGGKDTLASLLLLDRIGVPYDLYSGYLPVGGSLEDQKDLLERLHIAVSQQARPIEVSIRDDFYNRDEDAFEAAGVRAQFFKTDFAVGHTANYVGYFPLILYHGYTQVWFNIEKSADDTMATWNGESINHQWCKSREYHELAQRLFATVAGANWFEGFRSPLHGLNDVAIYKIVAGRPDLLKQTHSCNYGKPWCRECPKCLFCYLMMSAYLGEQFAADVLGTQTSLFAAPSCQDHWHDLLSPKKVAWECVPSAEECRLAAFICLQSGIDYAILRQYALSPLEASRAYVRFSAPDWEATPQPVRGPLKELLAETANPLLLDVAIVGAGQAGLSAAYHAAQQGLCHVVLEATETGAAWLNRWDSFQLNTPNELTHLPGMTYEGSDPQGFAGGAEVAGMMKEHAARFGLPVIEHCPVRRLRRIGGRFALETPQGAWTARSVIVASGHYAKPFYPPTAHDLAPSFTVSHSRDYRRPAALPPGAVVVVGGGQSGAQIAEDLAEQGRKVFWSVGDRPCNYRRFRGKDFNHWWDVSGIQHGSIYANPLMQSQPLTAKRHLREDDHPLVSGKGGGGLGHSISYRQLWEDGIVLVGRFQRAAGSRLWFGADLRENIARANTATKAIRRKLDEIATRFGASPATAEDDAIDTDWLPPTAITELDLDAEEVGAIVFATGFEPGWPWIEIENLTDVMGYPMGYVGLHPVPGLYFIGLFNLQRLSSICLCNAGRDAEAILENLVNHLRLSEGARADAARTPVPSSPRRRIAVLLPTRSDRHAVAQLDAEAYDLHMLDDPAAGDVIPDDDFDPVAFVHRCVSYCRAAGAEAVIGSHALARLTSAIVAADLGFRGPSVESLLLAAHRAYAPELPQAPGGCRILLQEQTSRDAQRVVLPRLVRPAMRSSAEARIVVREDSAMGGALSQMRAHQDPLQLACRRLFERFADTIKYPLVEHRAVVVEHWSGRSFDIVVDGWCGRDGRAHLWSGAPRGSAAAHGRLGERTSSEVQQRALELAEDYGFASTFWNVSFALGREGRWHPVNVDAGHSSSWSGADSRNMRILQADIHLALGDEEMVADLCDKGPLSEDRPGSVGRSMPDHVGISR